MQHVEVHRQVDGREVVKYLIKIEHVETVDGYTNTEMEVGIGSLGLQEAGEIGPHQRPITAVADVTTATAYVVDGEVEIDIAEVLEQGL